MRSLLIANRGEIACRIIKTARLRGIRTIAVYSEADCTAHHVKLADEAVCIGPATAAESYLNIERIIGAARSSGASAIHPGYGFLSENPRLVEACESAGILFVGPSASAMRSMGLKDAAKRLMEQAGVPVVPGYHGDAQDAAFLLEQAQSIGFPVLIKARAGGGGKGMRKVDRESDFQAALQAAQRESASSFGDAGVLIEKYITAPRHIEVQVFGDKLGNFVHLFERDCSLQRRHQKVIEEAPAPGMSEPVREAMTQAAIRAAKAIDYNGAGTVEFIVDGSQALSPDGFWFMEMNTRLQVEHPVTEAITGVDLVEWQLLVAEGRSLPLRQSELRIRGHAVEARVYAENPRNGFLPVSGTLERLQFSTAGRVDSGVVQGDKVLPHYDPLLAKMVAHAQDRDMAFRQLGFQLAESVVVGTQTNREFLWRLVTHRAVLESSHDTCFIETHLAALTASDHLPELAALACMAQVDPANYLSNPSVQPCTRLVDQTAVGESVAARLGAWQLWGPVYRSLTLKVAGELYAFDIRQQMDQHGIRSWQVCSGDMPGFPSSGICFSAENQERIGFCVIVIGREVHVQSGQYADTFEIPPVGQRETSTVDALSLSSPMPGRVVALHCRPGEAVEAGQPVLSVEAMKMEQELSFARDGVIARISVMIGDQISAGSELAVLEEAQHREPETRE